MTIVDDALLDCLEERLDRELKLVIVLTDGRALTWDEWEDMDRPPALFKGIRADGCEHKHTRTRQLLAELGLNDIRIHKALGELRQMGGWCDCSVLINCCKARYDIPR